MLPFEGDRTLSVIFGNEYVDGFFDHSVVGVGSTTAFSGMAISVFDIQAMDESGNFSLVNSLDARLNCP